MTCGDCSAFIAPRDADYVRWEAKMLPRHPDIGICPRTTQRISEHSGRFAPGYFVVSGIESRRLESWERLDNELRAILISIMDNTIECLQTHARLMDSGEIPMMSGPAALRHVADMMNFVLIEQDADGE